MREHLVFWREMAITRRDENIEFRNNQEYYNKILVVKGGSREGCNINEGEIILWFYSNNMPFCSPTHVFVVL